MKKYRLLLIVIIFFCSINVYAKDGKVRTRDDLLVPKDVIVTNNNIEDILKTPSVDEDDKIYDFANVLSRDEENKIYEDIKKYIKKTKLDCVIVLTDDLCGFEINKYAYNFYDYNNFKDLGVVFVVHINGDKKNIFMGNNGKKDSIVFTTYTSSRIKNILKYVYAKVKKDDYYQASLDFVLLIEKFYEKDNGVSEDIEEEITEEKKVVPYIEIIIISLSLSFITALLIYKKFDKKIGNYHMNNIDITTLNVVLETDTCISK